MLVVSTWSQEFLYCLKKKKPPPKWRPRKVQQLLAIDGSVFQSDRTDSPIHTSKVDRGILPLYSDSGRVLAVRIQHHSREDSSINLACVKGEIISDLLQTGSAVDGSQFNQSLLSWPNLYPFMASFTQQVALKQLFSQIWISPLFSMKTFFILCFTQPTAHFKT